jgi:hypothetical protein
MGSLPIVELIKEIGKSGYLLPPPDGDIEAPPYPDDLLYL